MHDLNGIFYLKLCRFFQKPTYLFEYLITKVTSWISWLKTFTCFSEEEIFENIRTMHNRCGALRDNRDAITNYVMTQKFSRMSAAGDKYKHVALFTTRDTKMIFICHVLELTRGSNVPLIMVLLTERFI